MSKPKEYSVITPVGMLPKPNENEYDIAELAAMHFKSDVKFVFRSNVSTTPDILIVRYGQMWEIKNIRGNSKRTIQNNLRAAAGQSPNIILSLLATRMTQAQAIGRIEEYCRSGAVPIKRLLLVTKAKTVLVVKLKK